MLTFCFTLNSQFGTLFFVEFVATHISGNNWVYNYTINNDSLSADIEEFSIFFDYNLYENLIVALTPTNWDSLVIQPDLGLPDDGLYDVLALPITHKS
ncbi:hypothetical protein [Methyloprofundus sp.]|uniref:hypothetical protein n=1 Tax=Methyloprofundus sp. TaxID=2020875 RepID=UPI003D0BAA83